MAAAPNEGGLLRVRVQPRASRTEIVGWRADGTLSVRVSAAPVEDAANIAVGVLLAGVLGVRPSAVSVVHGARGREKTIRVTGLTLDEMKRRLPDTGGIS